MADTTNTTVNQDNTTKNPEEERKQQNAELIKNIQAVDDAFVSEISNSETLAMQYDALSDVAQTKADNEQDQDKKKALQNEAAELKHKADTYRSAANTLSDARIDIQEELKLATEDNISDIASANASAKKNLEITQDVNKELAAEIEKNASEMDVINESKASGNRLDDAALNNVNVQVNQRNLAMAQRNFKLPKWTYNDFAEEIDSFKKGLSSLTGEPGWFYFKLFFHFDDNYGLLGNILDENIENRYNPNDPDGKYGNTAFNYLYMRKGNYLADNLESRLYALVKFVKYLNFINGNCPWFFNSISGLGNCRTDLKELTKDKTIDIGCLEDAIDMRLTSLFHLYQHACFDDVNYKEIIPQNLRKFNMTVIVFHTPVKLLDTPVDMNGIHDEVFGLTNPEFKNRMSYKAYTFKGCEFDLDSINAVVGNQITNEQPVNLGKGTFKIRFDRCFSHVMNTWEHFLIGSDGTYYFKSDDTSLRPDIYKKGNDSFNQRINIWKKMNSGRNNQQLIDLTEKNLRRTYETYEDVLMGNLYGIDVHQYIDSVLYYNNNVIFGDLRKYIDGIYINYFDYYDMNIDTEKKLQESWQNMITAYKNFGKRIKDGLNQLTNTLSDPKQLLKGVGKNVLTGIAGSAGARVLGIRF